MDLAAFRAGAEVRAAAEDLEATRRTFRRAEASDETRRTTVEETRRTGDAAPPPAPASRAAVAKKPRGDLFYWGTRAVAAAVLACVVFATWEAVSDYRLYGRGQEFEHDVLAEQLTDPNQIWTAWEELSKGHTSSIFLRGARNAARQKFVAAAGQVIDTYRNNETQTMYLTDWQRAQTMLLHALSTDPEDKTLHGKLRLSEGHIARINGAAHASVTLLNEALQKFNEAQQLMPQSPDPALGMARVYVSLKDVDKAAAAFHQAETKGYQLGNREWSQLADGYRDRANRAWKDSFSVRGLPQEKEQIQQAANDYQRALDLYQKSAAWGNAAARITEMQASLESANTRLAQIAQEQEQTEKEEKKRSVANAILGLFNALRDKATKKSDH
jgi:tetratricopeptide (TPR) repeat protein